MAEGVRATLRAAVVGAAVGAVVWLVVYGVGGELPIWFAVALGVVATATFLLLRPVAAGTAAADLDPMTPPPPPLFSVPALSTYESRLAGSSHSWHVYCTRLQPSLVELAADRLRHRHGIDVDLDPDEARARLGEELWQWMTTPPTNTDDPHTRGPDVRTLDRLLRQIEAI